jgi:hypothetical protein
MADEPDGIAPDRQIAEYLNKHPKTFPRWDKNPRLKALGWPAPIYLNGRKHTGPGPRSGIFFDKPLTPSSLAPPSTKPRRKNGRPV